MGVGATGGSLPLCPHPQPHSCGLPGALEGLLPHLVWVRVAINLEICCPILAIPSPGSVVTLALALTCSGSPHFCFLPSRWQPLVANMRCQGYCTSTGQSCGCVCRPMEEAIIEVLLCIQVCHPPWALELDLIKGPFQAHGKGGDLLIITLTDLLGVLYENV